MAYGHGFISSLELFFGRSVSSGVQQGCIPSPLFFSMFINDLCSCIRLSKLHFYADDLQIYLSGIWME
jgi:hypothetical protein